MDSQIAIESKLELNTEIMEKLQAKAETTTSPWLRALITQNISKLSIQNLELMKHKPVVYNSIVIIEADPPMSKKLLPILIGGLFLLVSVCTLIEYNEHVLKEKRIQTAGASKP